LFVHHFQGISVDAAVSVDGDCTITHGVNTDHIEIEFGHSAGSLQLCLTENAAVKLVNAVTVAVEEFRQHRATLDRSDGLRVSEI